MARRTVRTGKSLIRQSLHSLPSGYVKIALENGEIVDLPIEKGDFP